MRSVGLEMRRLAIISTDFYSEDRALRYLNTGDRVKRYASWSAIFGAISGLFLGPLIVLFAGLGDLPGIMHVPAGHFLSVHIASNPLVLLYGPVINGLLFALFGALIAAIISAGWP